MEDCKFRKADHKSLIRKDHLDINKRKDEISKYYLFFRMSLGLCKWWPVAFMLPIACLIIVELGGITIDNKYYAFNSIYRWIWHSRLAGLEIILLVFATEFLYVGWNNSSLRSICCDRTASFWSDFAIFVAGHTRISLFLSAVLSFGLMFLSFEWLRRLIVDSTGCDIGLSNLPVVPQFFAAFILYTFFDYWSHRFEHTNVMWPLHRFHHAAEEFYIFTAVRVHPFSLPSVFLINGPMLIAGIDAEVFVTLNIFILYLRFLIHSRMPGKWGWFGDWVFMSPARHRKHHILEESYSGTNFGLITI